MKQSILSLFIMLGAAMAGQAQIQFGVKASGVLSDQRVSASKGSAFTNSRNKDYQAGIISEYKIGERFAIQPQLLYTRKTFGLLSSTGAADQNIRIHYAELPVNVIYKFPVSLGNVFVGAGASYSYAVSGRVEENGHRQALYGKGSDWKRQDVAANMTAGLQLHNGFFVSANTQKGLLDINKDKATTFRNRSMSVSVGYMLRNL